MTFDADLTACAALVERGDPERFAAAMASPPQVRRVLFPLYAFNIEVSRAPWVTQESMIAEMRLQWWRDALEEIKTGSAARRHEVVTPLSQVLDGASAEILDKLVAARRWDIYSEPFEDVSRFQSYLDDTAAGLMWVAARSLGADAQAEPVVRGLGRATGLSRFLRAVPALENAGKIPLVDGRPEAVAALCRDALADCGGMSVRRCLVRKARPALTEAYQTQDIIRQGVADPRRVADGTLRLHPVRRSFRLWQWS